MTLLSPPPGEAIERTLNMAWIIKRGAYWHATWNQDGKPIRKSTGIPIEEHGKSAKQLRRTAETQAEAMERLAKGRCTLDEAQDALRAVAVANGMSKAVPSVVELLDSVPRDSTASSERNRERSHKLFIEFLGKRAHERVDMITEDDCRAFVKSLLGRVSCATIVSRKVYLSSAFQKSVRDGFRSRNPWEGVCVAKIAKGAGVNTKPQEREAFSVEELKIILTQFPEVWRDMAAVSYYCHGLRLSDVCLMRWSYIDFERERIFIPAEKKTGKARSCLMEGKLLAIMERRRRACLDGNEYVFPLMAERYKHSPGYLSTQFTSLLRAFGILDEDDGKPAAGCRYRMSKKSFHSIRHTAISGNRADSNLTPDECRALAGHDSERVERGYFHLSEEKERYALKRLEAAVR